MTEQLLTRRCRIAAAVVTRAVSLTCPGSWYTFLEIMGYIAVMSNLGVVIFTDPSDFFVLSSVQDKLIAFVIIEVNHVAVRHPIGLTSRLSSMGGRLAVAADNKGGARFVDVGVALMRVCVPPLLCSTCCTC